MRIKIPDKVQVASHTYEINFVSNLIRDEGDRGKLTPHRMLIELDDNMHESLTPVTFLHELLHVIDRHYNCERLHEDDVLCLSEGLCQVLKDIGIEFEQ